MADKTAFPNLVILFLAIVFAVAFVGMSYPYGFPLFSMSVLVVLVGAFFYFLYGAGIKVIDGFDNVFLLFYGLLICGYLYAWFIFNGEINRFIEKDIWNVISLSSLLVALLVLISNRCDAERLYCYFSTLIIILMVPVGLTGLYKIYMLNQGVLLEQYFSDGKYINGTSLVVDYNFYSLSHIFALVFVTARFQRTKSFFVKLFCATAGAVFVVNILLSGSRRGLVVVGVMIAIYGLYIFYNITKSLFHLLSLKFRTSYIKNGGILLAGLIVILAAAPRLEINETAQLNSLLYRATTILDVLNSGNKQSSFSQRTEHWKTATSIIERYSWGEFFFGNGFHYHREINRSASNDGDVDYPHNLLISVFLSNGLLGVVISCLMVGYILYMLYNIRTEHPVLLLLYGIMFLYISTSGDQWFSTKAHIVLIFLIFTMFRYGKSHE